MKLVRKLLLKLYLKWSVCADAIVLSGALIGMIWWLFLT